MHKRNMDTGVTGLMWMTLMVIGQYAIRLLTTFFLARLLTPEDYGEMAAINILVGFAELFWMLGVGPAIVQKKELSASDIATGNTINVLLGIIVFSSLNIFTQPLCNLFGITYPLMLRVYSFVFILHSICGVSRSLAQKNCRYKSISLIQVSAIIIFGVVAIILALLKFGVWTLVISSIIENIFIAAAYLIIEPIGMTFKIKKDSALTLLHFGGGYTLGRVLNYVANNGDYFVINKTLGKVQLGSYSKSYQLLMYPVNLIGESLDRVLFPLLSKNQDEKHILRRVCISGMSLILIISMPISIVSFLYAEHLVLFILGDQWSSVVLPFKIMVSGLFFRIGYKLSESLVRSLGKVYPISISQAVYALIVVVGAFIGHYWGLPGVAVGVTCAFTTNYFLITIMSLYYTNTRISAMLSAMLPSLFYGTVATIVMVVIKQYLILINSHFIVFVTATIICFGVYGLLFVFTRKKVLNNEVNQFIEQLIDSALNKVKALFKREKHKVA